MVAVSPLLADLIRHVLVARADLQIVAEFSGLDVQRLRELAPDVVILGQTAGKPVIDLTWLRALLAGVCVLALSPDLAQLFGPGAEDVAVFTADTLAERLPR